MNAPPARPLTCQQCGAAITLPPDLMAMTVRCAYCGRENPLPNDLVAFRQQQVRAAQAAMQSAEIAQQHQQAVKSSMSLVTWIILLTVLPGLIGGGIAIYSSFKAVDDVTRSIPAIQPRTIATPATAIAPIDPPVPVVPLATPHPPKDAKVVEQRMTALMKEKYTAGCKNVLLAPRKTEGTSSSKADLKKGPFCLVMLLVSSNDDNKLTMTMTSPLGEKVATPAPSTEIVFSYCATIDGPYAITVEPATDDYYMLGSVDCPASVVNAKKK